MTQNHENSFHILFVDDEEKTRKMFTRLVASHYNVLVAEDVPSAIAQLEQHSGKIGVLLTDQRMPGQLGAELLRHTRKEYPAIIRMLTTAYSDLDDAIDAVNTGEIYRYIHKPWNIDELLIDLRLAMNLFELQRDRQQLIEEKMSVSSKQSRIGLVQELLCIVSGQVKFSSAMGAVVRGLKQSALALDGIPSATLSESYWDVQVKHASLMLQVSESVSSEMLKYDLEATNQSVSLSSVAQFSGLDDGSVLTSQLSDSGVSALATSIANMFQLDQTNISCAVESGEGTQTIRFNPSTPTSSLLDLLSVGHLTQDNQVKLMTGFLTAIILASVSGGMLDLRYEGSELIEVVLSFNDAKSQSSSEMQQSADFWIEDLFVLFS